MHLCPRRRLQSRGPSKHLCIRNGQFLNGVNKPLTPRPERQADTICHGLSEKSTPKAHSRLNTTEWYSEESSARPSRTDSVGGIQSVCLRSSARGLVRQHGPLKGGRFGHAGGQRRCPKRLFQHAHGVFHGSRARGYDDDAGRSSRGDSKRYQYLEFKLGDDC